MKHNLNILIICIVIILVTNISSCSKEIDSSNEEFSKNSVQKYAATYFGGNASDSGWGIALDDDGNIYTAGYTASPDFPTTAGTYNSTLKGKADVIVLKMDKDLKTILASTIIGGSEDEVAYSILCDKKGCIYIAGYTSSKDFPVSPSAYCTKYNGGEGDGFILKMDKDLKSIIASTFIGGSGNEDDWFSAEIVLDKNGDIYIAGNTSSTDFPTTNDAYRLDFNGGGKDIFISKFDSELKNLLASTLFGGAEDDHISRGLQIDKKSDEICIAGYTHSQDFPTTKNAYSKNITIGEPDGFIAKFTPDLSELKASTILDKGWTCSMLIHENGDIYVGGHATIGFPTTSKAYYQTFDKHFYQGFISRFSNDLSKLLSSSLLPGTDNPLYGGGINPLNLAQNPQGDIISTGWAMPKDFPSTPGSFDETQNGGSDTYVLKINKNLSKILASTFIGGSNDEVWHRMKMDKHGNCYIAGYTSSHNFPITGGSAFEKFIGGKIDGFILRLDENLSADNYEEFHDAAKRDELKKVKTMLSENSTLLDKTDTYKRTALHSAARYGALSVCQYLIKKEANLDAKDESGNTPLHLAAMHCHDDAAGLLINADLNAFNDDGASPLSLAIDYGTSKTVGVLLSNKADANIKDRDGNTLLHLAALRIQVEKVQEMLKINPEIDYKNNTGNTPLFLAVRVPDNLKIIECLLDHGASLAASDTAGNSILHIASQSNMELLIKRGADIDAQDKDGNTVLHLTLRDLFMIKYFHPSLKDRMIMLMKADADPYLRNKEGKSAIDLAIESGVQDAVDLLKNKR